LVGQRAVYQAVVELSDRWQMERMAMAFGRAPTGVLSTRAHAQDGHLRLVVMGVPTSCRSLPKL